MRANLDDMYTKLRSLGIEKLEVAWNLYLDGHKGGRGSTNCAIHSYLKTHFPDSDFINVGFSRVQVGPTFRTDVRIPKPVMDFIFDFTYHPYKYDQLCQDDKWKEDKELCQKEEK